MKVKTSKKNWTLHGINLIPSDEIYKKIVKAIETGNVTQEHLQKVTGSNAPILVDIQKRTIQFCTW